MPRSRFQPGAEQGHYHDTLGVDELPVSELGGAGGAVTLANSIILSTASPVDISQIGTVAPAWDIAYDNPNDFNVVETVPDGLGLDIKIDGSRHRLIVTEAGAWAFTYVLFLVGGTDATLGFSMDMPGLMLVSVFGPGITTELASNQIGASGVFALPVGTETSMGLSTYTAATAGSYAVTPYLVLLRL